MKCFLIAQAPDGLSRRLESYGMGVCCAGKREDEDECAQEFAATLGHGPPVAPG